MSGKFIYYNYSFNFRYMSIFIPKLIQSNTLHIIVAPAAHALRAFKVATRLSARPAGVRAAGASKFHKYTSANNGFTINENLSKTLAF